MRTRPPKRTISLPTSRSREKSSLANDAYTQIRNEILQGALAVGDILSRRKLAERLKISFLPITEALQRLEAEGLVESRPRIGTRVRIPTKQDILDNCVIREALETEAARRCCEQMQDTEREQLLQSAKKLDSLYKASTSETSGSGALFSAHKYHMQFHMKIAELARSPGLLRAIEREQVLIFNWLCDTTVHRRSLPSSFHYDLTKAICSHDLAKADGAMRSHIRYGLNEIVERLLSLETSKRWRLTRSS